MEETMRKAGVVLGGIDPLGVLGRPPEETPRAKAYRHAKRMKEDPSVSEVLVFEVAQQGEEPRLLVVGYRVDGSLPITFGEERDALEFLQKVFLPSQGEPPAGTVGTIVYDDPPPQTDPLHHPEPEIKPEAYPDWLVEARREAEERRQRRRSKHIPKGATQPDAKEANHVA